MSSDTGPPRPRGGQSRAVTTRADAAVLTQNPAHAGDFAGYERTGSCCAERSLLDASASTPSSGVRHCVAAWTEGSSLLG